MVFYFEAVKGYTLYMGADKHENEHLIAHAWPEDLWFHVDKMSSAHVYLRMKKEEVRHERSCPC
jgi:predicted ribosome quality control (RQC) complex YloA/Tae2 family protein